MRRGKTSDPRRPLAMSGLAARTAKDAAIHLVRLEFDRSRLDRGIAEAEARIARLRRDLDIVERRRATLLDLMTR